MRAAAIIAVCVVLAILLGLGVWAWIGWQNGSARNLAVHEQAVAANATVAAGQAQAQTNATQIVVSGGARDSVDITLHQANAQAIQAAPGADAVIDPALNAAGIRGLCAHPAYAHDPACTVTP